MKSPDRATIIAAFGDALANRGFSAGREADLPFPKTAIREALLAELLNPSRPDTRGPVEVGYLELESFVSDSDWEVVREVESTYPADVPRTAADLTNADLMRALSVPQEIQDRYLEILRDVKSRIESRARELESVLADRKDLGGRAERSIPPAKRASVIAYRNTDRQCFCQLRLPSGHRVLISIASAPQPSVKIFRMALGGILPVQTLWELNPRMAGGYAQYVQRLVDMFATSEGRHPLDEIRDALITAQDAADVSRILVMRERDAGV